MKPELERYAELVRAWPANLVSAGDAGRLDLHVEDALAGSALLVHYNVTTLVDVGSGAGFPAIPLTLNLPHLEVELVESRERKAQFLVAAIAALGLEERVRVHQLRAEEAVSNLGRECYNAASCRALAPPAVAAELLSPFVAVGGTLFLWATSAQAETVRSMTLPMLGLLAPPVAHATPSPLRDDGVILAWAKAAPAERRFPRRPGVAARKPPA